MCRARSRERGKERGFYKEVSTGAVYRRLSAADHQLTEMSMSVWLSDANEAAIFSKGDVLSQYLRVHGSKTAQHDASDGGRAGRVPRKGEKWNFSDENR